MECRPGIPPLKAGLWSQGMRFFLPGIAPGCVCVCWEGMLFSARRQCLEPDETLAVAATGDSEWDSIDQGNGEGRKGGKDKNSEKCFYLEVLGR